MLAGFLVKRWYVGRRRSSNDGEGKWDARGDWPGWDVGSKFYIALEILTGLAEPLPNMANMADPSSLFTSNIWNLCKPSPHLLWVGRCIVMPLARVFCMYVCFAFIKE